MAHFEENLTLIQNLQKFFIFEHQVALQSRKTDFGQNFDDS